MKKHIRFSIYIVIVLLIIIWLFKQLGYPLIWYGLNGYYNFYNENKMKNEKYILYVPFWDWKIIRSNSKSTTLEGITNNKIFIYANIRHKVEVYNLNTLKMMCSEKEPRIIKNKNNYNIFCSIKNKQSIEKYRIFFIPNKVIIFMNGYQEEYSNKYNKLLENIEIK